MKLINKLSQEDKDKLQNFIQKWCTTIAEPEKQINNIDDYLADLEFSFHITPTLGMPVWDYKYDNEETIEIWNDLNKWFIEFSCDNTTVFLQKFESAEDLIKFMETN